jgi:small subunit ribosomal protein S20
MPITKSAKKALRQSARKKGRNDRRKLTYKTAVKEFKKAVEAGNFDAARDLLPKVYQSVDKAAKGNTIKKNKAARIKSRLSARLSARLSK